MPCLHAKLIGRFGNLLFQYAHCRAWCEQSGYTLQTDPWIGERIFKIEDERPHPKPDRVFSGYAQTQDDLIYTRKQCREWFRFRPEIANRLISVRSKPMLAHRRMGDYGALGYVVVTMQSYMHACNQHGLNVADLQFVSEEYPQNTVLFDKDMEFVEDFWRMVHCKTLLRGNSSFSWWAATLGECRVFSPCIKGKEGGRTQRDCEFTEGNHERFANLELVTDLHLFRDSDRYDYPLTRDSLVVDCGGYHGQFADEIIKRFGCKVEIFEPRAELADRLMHKYNGNPRVSVSAMAVGGSSRQEQMQIKGDMSGIFAEGQPFITHVMDFANYAAVHTIDLLKLNIEGMEFEVLERLIACDLAKKCRAIQVQFHPVVPNALSRYAWIREQLLKTHRPTFQEPWCWESFELR